MQTVEAVGGDGQAARVAAQAYPISTRDAVAAAAEKARSGTGTGQGWRTCRCSLDAVAVRAAADARGAAGPLRPGTAASTVSFFYARTWTRRCGSRPERIIPAF